MQSSYVLRGKASAVYLPDEQKLNFPMKTVSFFQELCEKSSDTASDNHVIA